METLKAISSRRSVRRFDNTKHISVDIIEKILHAGMYAPSAINQQPWHFVLLRNKEIINQIPTIHPHSNMCLQAPAVIVMCVDPSEAHYKEFWQQDMSASVQNILLAIRDLGLGGVWVGVYPNQDRVVGIQKLLNLPENIIPFALIPFGYTEVVQHELKERIKPERIHFDKW